MYLLEDKDLEVLLEAGLLPDEALELDLDDEPLDDLLWVE